NARKRPPPAPDAHHMLPRENDGLLENEFAELDLHCARNTGVNRECEGWQREMGARWQQHHTAIRRRGEWSLPEPVGDEAGRAGAPHSTEQALVLSVRVRPRAGHVP